MDAKDKLPDIATDQASGDATAYEKRDSITGDNYISADHGADTELKRLLSTRHITMIALGSSIGMGLWLGSGTSLRTGGPAAIFLGYVLAGSMIWCVSHSIGEMACLYPLPSAFVQWSGQYEPTPLLPVLPHPPITSSVRPANFTCVRYFVRRSISSLQYGERCSLVRVP